MQVLPTKAHEVLTSDTLEQMSAAVEAGDHRSVQMLLDSGADVNAVTKNGMTLLMRACCDGRPEIIRLLLDKGADLNAKRSDGFTALSFAAFFGHTEAVRLLLKSGADITAKSRFGTSAEMWARARGFKEIATLLIDAPKPKLSPPTLQQSHPRVHKTTERKSGLRAPALPEAGLEYLPEVPATLTESVTSETEHAKWSKLAVIITMFAIACGTSLVIVKSFPNFFRGVDAQAVGPLEIQPISPISIQPALESAVAPNVAGEDADNFDEKPAEITHPTASRASGNQGIPRIIPNLHLPKSLDLGTQERKTGTGEFEGGPAPLVISSSEQTESTIQEKPSVVVEKPDPEGPLQKLDGSIISNKPKKKVIQWP